MSKRALAIALAVLMTATVWSVVGRADVNGSFDLFITMQPQTTSGETSEFDFDFEAELDLNVTLSGLTFSNAMTYGIGGVEHYIMALSTTLGALDILDEFVFATPYYGVSTSYWGMWYFFDWIHPKRGHYGGTRRGNLLFVKKRVTTELTIGGLTFNNLFMLEDVTFPLPSATDPGVNYVGDDQSWAVGDIMSISGTTVSGIGVTSWSMWCADAAITAYYPKHQLLKIFEWDYNLIKKKRWLQTVEPDCYPAAIQVDPEDATAGYKPILGFTKEVISITDVPLPSGISMDMLSVFSTVPYKLDWYPWNCPAGGTWCVIQPRVVQIPFFTDIVFQVPIMGMADLLVELWTSDIDSIWFDKFVLTLQLPEHGWFLHWYDHDGDLTMTVTDDVVFKGGVSFQEAVDLSFFAWMQPTLGPQLLELDLTIPIDQPTGYLEFLFNWMNTGTVGALDFQYWSIKLNKNFGQNEFEIRAKFDKYGFDEAAIIISTLFSI
jgi:hypothetical protein